MTYHPITPLLHYCSLFQMPHIISTNCEYVNEVWRADLVHFFALAVVMTGDCTMFTTTAPLQVISYLPPRFA